MMKKEEIAAIYSSVLLSQHSKVADSDSQFAYLRRFLPVKKDAMICDAGCGNGRFARKLARLGYTNVKGVDLFDHEETGGSFSYQKGSIDALPFDDRVVDLLFSFSVIYYLADPAAGLREYVRVLKPGAVLLFSAHTRYSLFTLERLVARRFGGAPHLRDVRFYSAAYYRETALQSGLEIIDVDGFNLIYVPSGLPLLTRCVSFVSHGLHCHRWLNEPGNGPAWLRRFRSEIGYHCLIATRKPLARQQRPHEPSKI